jgi:hypothetical protein
VSGPSGRHERDPEAPRVVPLNPGVAPPRPAAPSPPNRLLAAATTGMVACALVGIFATLAFITIGWPGATGRRVIAVVVLAAVGFMAFAATAVIAAARATYPRRSRDAN